MTKVQSLSTLKRGYSTQKGDKPREGSRLRKAYDALRRGETIYIYTNLYRNKYSNYPDHYPHGIQKDLVNYYGMELRTIKLNGHGAKGNYLIGEWYGPYFVKLEQIMAEEDDYSDEITSEQIEVLRTVCTQDETKMGPVFATIEVLENENIHSADATMEASGPSAREVAGEEVVCILNGDADRED